MSEHQLNQYKKVVIGTGNVLSKEDFKKATSPANELVICLKSAIDLTHDKEKTQVNDSEFVSIESDILKNDENSECPTTKIVAKLFLNEYSETCIDEALEYLAKTFNNRVINTLILAYHPIKSTQQNINEQSSPSTKFIWADNDETSKENFKKLWKKLQKYYSDGKIRQLGISDMTLETILDIFNDSYDFEILQINLSTCCVVPKDLQMFCKERDIQLLTHSDPQVILSRESLEELKLSEFNHNWSVKYQIHYIDRGILAFKGYIVSVSKV